MFIKLTTKQINLAVCLGLFLLTVVSRVPVMRAVGETWDEQTAATGIGIKYISNIRHLNFSKDAWNVGAEHPPLARYFYGIAWLIPKSIPQIAAWDSEYQGDKEYTVPRLLSAVFGGLTVILVFLIGKFLFSRRVGLVSSLILTALPPFIAYTSTSSLESVFIFTTTLFMWSLVHALKTGSSKWHLLAAVTLTLSFLTRYNGLFFFVFYSVVVFTRYRKKITSLQLRQIPLPILLSPLIFLVLTYLLWPWLWTQPLGLLESFSRTPAFVKNEYFLGKIGPMPWYYYFIYFLVTTPEVVLILLLSFITLKILNKLPITNDKWSILLLWFLTPFLATLVSFKQDGVRYVIAFAPALALISGYTAIWVFGYLKTKFLKVSFLTLALLGLMYPAILFFPYYLDYFNFASGGPKAAYEYNRFDIGWWGEGGLAAVRFINKTLPNQATIKINFLPFHVLPKFRSDLILVRDNNKEADYILTNVFSQNYGPTANLKNYKLIFEESTPLLKSFSASLVHVYRRESGNI